MSAKRINRWPDFHGQPAASYGCDNGRRYLLFGEDIAKLPASEVPSNRLRRTRVGYQLFGDTAILHGILVNSGGRGSNRGEHMLEYFLGNVGNLEGRFGGTSRIHKPVVSLQLARIGLRVEQPDFKAVILPRSKYDASPHIPKITVLEDEVADRARVIDRVDCNVFYEKVDPITAQYTYPVVGHEIHLHSAFVD